MIRWVTREKPAGQGVELNLVNTYLCTMKVNIMILQRTNSYTPTLKPTRYYLQLTAR